MLLSTGSGVVQFLLGFSPLFAIASAASNSNAASIFNYSLKQNSNFTFALNIPDGSSDLYFHLSGPTDYSWVAVGTGSRMKDSLMIVVYSSADGKNVTVSPRYSSGEQEPVYSPSLVVDILDGTGIFNNSMIVNARCSNCTSWATGSLDLQSTSQSWIFGLGPTGGEAAMLRSNSKTASIERHSKYGVFTMDMVHAKGGPGGLPTSYTTSVGSASSEPVTNDSNWPSIIHALCLCVALILLNPAGVILLRVIPKSVRWHWINQTFSSAIAIVGIIVGFYLSTMFTKSQSYGSAHQILGILILLAILAQWGMGGWHHLVYRRTQSPTRFGVVHRYFGYVIFFFAVVNGGIGLTWSYASKSVVIGYSVVAAIISIGLIAVFSWARWNARRDQKSPFSDSFQLRGYQRGDDSDSYLGQDTERVLASDSRDYR
ncbi:uncharacterized protein N7477_000189 [Penicillium maclennaniae]|uniref:uncharacterized protein n=1 Tax=Penicillium maclennaniae TaxID=1343394 RepID=UPI002541AD01|nr:uncharacterized protein N7477_000189 [Penicillium maclennaniae]KAJ5683844.1 hypothetical protein N7477_000189 [Penicillium maclennaniae]